VQATAGKGERPAGRVAVPASRSRSRPERRRIDGHAVLDRFSVADARVYGELIYEYRFRTAA
jgi:hypothetical protein